MIDTPRQDKRLSKIKIPVLLPLTIALFLIWLLFVGVAWFWFESAQQRSLQERITQFDDQLFQMQSNTSSQMAERLGLIESLVLSDESFPVETVFEQIVSGMKLSRLAWIKQSGELKFEVSASLLPLDIALQGRRVVIEENGHNVSHGLVLLPSGDFVLRVVRVLAADEGMLIADYPFAIGLRQLAKAQGIYANLIVREERVDKQLMQAYPSVATNQPAVPFTEQSLSVFSSDALVNVREFAPIYEQMKRDSELERSAFATSVPLAEEYYDVSVLPLFNGKGEPLAEMMVVKNATLAKQETAWLQWVVTIAALVIATLLMFFFYFLLGRIERSIQSSEIQIIEERDRSESLRIESETLRLEAEGHRESAEAARDEAEKASAVKSEFLAKMSHELRTPLNAVIGLSEMMHEDAKEFGDDDYVEPLERVIRASKHLLNLINEILDISKIEAGKMELHLEGADLDALVAEVVETAEPLAADKSLDFIIDKPELGSAEVDPTRFKQVLFNLVSNAIKFTDTGAVSLKAVLDDSRLRVSIEDTGAGMSEEQVSTLFQEFVQLDSKSNRKHEGTGLGLAISRKFAQMMGGDISVSSEVGVGSIFTFSMPIQRPTDVNDLHDDSAVEIKSLLLIDDDPTSVELIKKYIPSNVEVIVALNGVQALSLARQHQVDLITLDVEMPLLNGWDTLAALRADKTLADIPVVIISVSEERERAFSMGATDYLVKPIKPNDIERILPRLNSTSHKTLSVLLVDDSEEIRISSRKLFERLGVTVFEAGNGEEALEKLSEHKPDFMILDLMMPKMDGFELLQKIRGGVCQDLDVYIMSAMELTPEQKQWLEGRANAVLSKGGEGENSFLHHMKSIVQEMR
ncbi:hypothetical protein DN730_13045 [Marinomonas piezotolerans]|uniref:histidine kinase n=1 Tax=Marinomonas piezotolerans TaxID=2213058 RepID=A0A370U7A7_9GAMM|nr:response regulator [Marinomonas piezotolerans]RDL43667.1 hypothetical protein DN730_13045 [Marinomonas piezotolerans]